jgi:hypothetical protein
MIAALAWAGVIVLLAALVVGIHRYERKAEWQAARERHVARRRLLAELDRLDQDADG